MACRVSGGSGGSAAKAEVAKEQTRAAAGTDRRDERIAAREEIDMGTPKAQGTRHRCRDKESGLVFQRASGGPREPIPGKTEEGRKDSGGETGTRTARTCGNNKASVSSSNALPASR